MSLLNSKEIISSLFPTGISYIEFSTPGFSLTKKISNLDSLDNLIFLENHGVIVSGLRFHECYQSILDVNKKCEDYIRSNVAEFMSFKDFFSNYDRQKIPKHDKFFFPDEIVFKDSKGFLATKILSEYVRFISEQLGPLRYLKEVDVCYIQNMKFEINRGKK